MAKRSDKSNKAQASAVARFGRYFLILLLAGAVCVAWLSMLTFDPGDPPTTIRVPANSPVHNLAGTVGASIAHYLRYWIGGGAYMGLLFLSVAAVIWMVGGHIRDLAWRVLGLALLIASTSAAVYMLQPNTPVLDVAAGASGILGTAVGKFLLAKLNYAAWLLDGVVFLAGLLLTVENLVLQAPKAGHRLATAVAGILAPVGATILAIVKLPTRLKLPKFSLANLLKNIKLPKFSRGDGSAKPKPEPKVKAQPPAKAKPQVATTPVAAIPATVAPVVAPVAIPAPVPVAAKPKPAPEPAKAQPRAEKQPSDPNARYKLPSTTLLAEPTGGYIQTQTAQAQTNATVLQQTLNDFNVGAQVVGHMTGPVITMFELSLSPGVKVSQVANLATDIARSLAVPGVRIVSPIPGKDTVGIEVPNLQKEIVRIKELMNIAPDADRKLALPLYLGKDAGGGAIIADLSRMPHMLIAGTTGSGKSVCINTIIMSILLTRTPDDCRFILVDPKMVEMAAFESIPHLLCPVVNDMHRAEDILEWAATKMDERYELLKEAGVKNIAGYNTLTPEELFERFGVETDEEKSRIQRKMPYYVIIIDELADLIMTSSKEVESHIIRIAQKARAVGIHLILATQRPSVNVVTGLIKSNMPCRVSFRVASRQESRIVLDQNGAEVLMGQGDMLLLQPGTSNLVRAQGTYMDDGEIRSVVEALKEAGDPQYSSELMRLGQANIGEGGGEKDDLFDQAVEIVLASQRGSVSLLQRRLQVGYSRASRIIDQMAEAGLLGDYKGSQARECNMTLDEWQALKSSIASDQSGESALNGEPTSA